MNSREAFEAHIRSEFRTATVADEYLRKHTDGTYLNNTIRNRWISWQAATAHARDVAVNILTGVNNYDNPMTANDCADAIKEALK